MPHLRGKFSADYLNAKQLFANGTPILGNPSGGADYFVDLNASSATTPSAMATHDAGVTGLSWGTAFQLLSSAIAASNTSIGLAANRWWARRNRIFVCGDGIVESLTVAPEKCDIIGVGTDLYAFPRVTGVHSFAADKPGTRWINMGFQGSGAGDLYKTTVGGNHGLSFLGCHFVPTNGGMTRCIEVLDVSGLRVMDCTVTVGAGSMTHIFGEAIGIDGLASIHDTIIKNNLLIGTKGIVVTEATAVAMGSLIEGNTIRATGKTIDDASGDFMVVNNRLITDINTSTSTDGYTFNLQLACGNIQMGVTGLGDTIPFAKIAES